VNAGHAGFGTDNELLFYEDEGRRYDPDLVVQVFNFGTPPFFVVDAHLTPAGHEARRALTVRSCAPSAAPARPCDDLRCARDTTVPY